MTETLTKLAYQTFQQGKSIFGLAHKTLGTQLQGLVAPDSRQPTEPLSPELLALIQQRLNQLLETDWQEAEQGIYPVSLLFENPWNDFLRYYPLLWVDMPQSWERIRQKRFQDFTSEIKTAGYPSYYLQNFHHQTDGYLSDWSANLYDIQVEILFNGTADAMRRRVLAPLKQGLTGADVQPVRILDIACGTGRTLRQIRAALPDASLFGVDLSPAYLRKANQLLSGLPGELPQLIQANAEELPYLDSYFHAVTCVFLFHELPPEVRQRVINESYRVLQPGGTFIICDSIQLSDSPELAPAMRNFATIFHEPYYRHYTMDDLNERLTKAGFTTVKTAVHFMSKYWVARKPV
ncbi:MAG: class I SAM-dependent methyltransferase [Synechococcales cyanobacterium M58_A2018_015]|nr:class I SAM-dependent methyltransferase [Synechococcales cyanobacterium M58_A2018_015]